MGDGGNACPVPIANSRSDETIVPRPARVITKVLPLQVVTIAKERRVIVIRHHGVGRIGRRDRANARLAIAILDRAAVVAPDINRVAAPRREPRRAIRRIERHAAHARGRVRAWITHRPIGIKVSERRTLTSDRHTPVDAAHVIDIAEERIGEIPMPDRHTRPVAQRNAPDIVATGLIPEAAADDECVPLTRTVDHAGIRANQQIARIVARQFDGRAPQFS